MALALEDVALNDEYFIEKNLYPNVDFYSGIIYQALGIPTSMFTVCHPLSVAQILASMRMDRQTISAALLHDVVEDTDITLKDIETIFDPEVASLVDSVSKIDQIKFGDKAEAQAETFRKMILAMVKDIRVILIKLSDRLHNMRTLEHLPDKKRKIFPCAPAPTAI